VWFGVWQLPLNFQRNQGRKKGWVMDLRRALNTVADFAVEVTSQGLSARLSAFQNALQAAIANASGEPEFANQAKTLFSLLDESASNGWQPTQRRLLEQLGLAGFTGRGLRENIEAILLSSGMQRSVLGQKTTELVNKAQTAYTTATQIVTGFKTLGAAIDTPKLEQCETAILIPVQDNNDTLGHLEKDTDGFNKLLKTLNELTGETGVSPRVTGLDSGSWVIYVEQGLEAAAKLVAIILGIIKMRQEVGNLRKKTQGLQEESEIPPAMIEQLEKIATAKVESRLKEIVEQTVSQAQIADATRRNELIVSLSINVHFLARQLDDGVRIEITPPAQIPESLAKTTKPNELVKIQANLEMLKTQAPAIAKMEDVPAHVLMLTDESAGSQSTSANTRLPPPTP
jgi:hypothetical protein